MIKILTVSSMTDVSQCNQHLQSLTSAVSHWGHRGPFFSAVKSPQRETATGKTLLLNYTILYYSSIDTKGAPYV